VSREGGGGGKGGGVWGVGGGRGGWGGGGGGSVAGYGGGCGAEFAGKGGWGCNEGRPRDVESVFPESGIMCVGVLLYRVATISRLLQIIGLSCRISSL